MCGITGLINAEVQFKIQLLQYVMGEDGLADFQLYVVFSIYFKM